MPQTLRKRISRSLVLRVGAANVVGAALSSLLPVGQRGANQAFLNGSGLPLLIGYVALSVGGLSSYAVHRGRLALGWLDDNDPPTAADRSQLLALPRLVAGLCVVGWSGAGVVFAVWTAVIGGTALDAFETIARNGLGAIVSATVGYLLSERTLRPVVARAFADASGDRPHSVGLRGRLVAAWALGSAVPLTIVGLAFLGRDAESRASLAASSWEFVVAGLVVGASVTLVVGRSIIEPLDRVRLGLARVGQGELDVRLPVDDGTELGLLQDGFNRMAAGLREREHLRDLFGRHVGVEVAAYALESGIELAEQRRPDEIAALLNAVFAEVVAAITREGGWVNKFEGDAALCVFGPPIGHSDHAARALRAAIALRSGLEGLGATSPEINAGIGIASGLVFAGNVGAADRYEYTVLGNAVNQAARVTELAKDWPSRLLASGTSVGAAGSTGAAWTLAIETVLRGRSGTTQLFEPPTTNTE